MASFPLTYRCKSLAVGRRILEVMQQEHGLLRDASARRTEIFLDTLDGCIRSGGGSLALGQNGAASWLAWRTAAEELLHRVQVPNAPSFARDLPPGPFHEALTRAVGSRKLLAVARLDTRRVTLSARDEEHKIVARVALEHGTCTDPERDDAHRRLPVTLQVLPVRGYDAEAGRVSRLLSGFPDLVPLEPSRLSRALDSLGVPRAERAAAPGRRIDPTERADVATVRVLAALLRDLVGVEDAVRRDVDAEALHDFRVAIRRTRAVLAQMKKVLPAARIEHFRKEHAWLARSTGLLRDLDVQLQHLPELRPRLAGKDAPGLEPILSLLRDQRSRAREMVVGTLSSERYAVLIESWRRFLDQPERIEPPPKPIGAVAVKRIRRALHEVLTRGRSIHERSTWDELHRLRVAGKKLRYLLELFGGAFPEREVDALVRALRKLQDVLGRINDLRIERGALARLGEEMAAGGTSPPETGRTIEAVLAALEDDLGRERTRFERSFAQFDSPKSAARFTRLFDGGRSADA